MIIKTAPILLVDSSKLQYIKYGFGDASGGRFGVTIKVRAVLDIETGTWNALGSHKSSNFRELSNFVYKLEKDAAEGNLTSTKTFMFTDNTTPEAVYYNGTSCSPEIFKLFIRLRKLEL